MILKLLDQLCEIQELTGTKLHRRLAELNVDSPGELQCHIKAVRATVEDLKRKITLKDEFNNGILTREWLQSKVNFNLFYSIKILLAIKLPLVRVELCTLTTFF